MRVYLLLPDFTSWFTIRFRKPKARLDSSKAFTPRVTRLFTFPIDLRFSSPCTSGARYLLSWNASKANSDKAEEGKQMNCKFNSQIARGGWEKDSILLLLSAADEAKYYSRLPPLFGCSQLSLKFKSRRHPHARFFLNNKPTIRKKNLGAGNDSVGGKKVFTIWFNYLRGKELFSALMMACRVNLQVESLRTEPS